MVAICTSIHGNLRNNKMGTYTVVDADTNETLGGSPCAVLVAESLSEGTGTGIVYAYLSRSASYEEGNWKHISAQDKRRYRDMGYVIHRVFVEKRS